MRATQDNSIDAWCRGYVAARDGRPETQNPYAEESALAQAWLKGWTKAVAHDALHRTYGVQGSGAHAAGQARQ